ncbi:hypothetical protein KAU33_10415 [Candidatus Dependentiae bacterium]|nr:hypothetical protein [Candidatus Dependentiae bacterium]
MDREKRNKRTVLSEKEADLLETLVSRFGEVVRFEEIYSLLKGEQRR